ncbi:AraC family transcriptional regulator [Acuticoccus sp. I52.16.1]|uniref:AraC family transcriptional regulator n=1 Tax=Acuticoccus sp. I52.16.1 TaxID=2928472 RepID=UPI001FD4D904|nr:AraC family transcriptional regulator [Acuticoccus sp. I52.16.1]UOM36269.1 AraC family transcriptional regulator [Acuticoccus sp. I52.16.1]
MASLSARRTVHLSTVSYAFVEDWLGTLRAQCGPEELAVLLDHAGLTPPEADPELARVTHDQIVGLYQQVVRETGDEMMGLWSRPIRSGALKHLCTVVLEASSILTSMHRFTSFWNMLLDDYRLELERDSEAIRVSLVPRDEGLAPHRFGHMLLLKLTHGMISWLAGRELPLREVGFAFARPDFAEDYPILFPATIGFDEAHSSISFDRALGGLPVTRSAAEMQAFLMRAPRDWIFTDYKEHALPLRVRELLHRSRRMSCQLEDAASALNMTSRTLIRRLAADATSFQGIKDGLRRDIAIRELTHGSKSLEAISQDLGFASAPNFHRAFKQWTGSTPASYRQRHSAADGAPAAKGTRDGSRAGLAATPN